MTAKLNPFSGDNSHWLQFDNEFTDLVLNITNVTTHGVATDVFSPEQLKIVIPDENTRKGLSAPELPELSSKNKDNFPFLMKDYRQYQDALRQVRALLIQALPDQFRQAHFLKSDHATITAKEIYATLVTKYGTMKLTSLDAEQAKLHTPYPAGTDIDDIITAHNGSHSIFAKAGFPLNEYTKLYAFRLAISQLSDYQRVVRIFLDDFPAVKDQTFKTLTLRCENAKNTMSLVPQAANIAEETPLCVPATVASKNKSANNSGKQHPQARQRPQPAEYAHCPHYCHAHGHGWHSSQECKLLEYGDQRFRSATATNQMNGSTKVAKEAPRKRNA